MTSYENRTTGYKFVPGKTLIHFRFVYMPIKWVGREGVQIALKLPTTTRRQLQRKNSGSRATVGCVYVCIRLCVYVCMCVCVCVREERWG